jgi:anti-sigma regulatory factor (Ser/Thr protein kinase)
MEIMISQQKKILELAKIKKQVKTRDIAPLLGVSRQYVNLLLNDLIAQEKIIKIGSTRSAFYILPEYAGEHMDIFPSRIVKKLKNAGLEEHEILDQIESDCPLILKLKENVRSIFEYAFSEMLNNAIEHSDSKNIEIEVILSKGKLSFSISDYGIGVFRNIMSKKGLSSEMESIQELQKGKTTTKPQAHSGEGIFFTSKSADIFILDSYGLQMIVNNKINDIFVGKPKIFRRGTRVSFSVDIKSGRHLIDVFGKYADVNSVGDFGFDKTEIKIKLFSGGSIYVSRSQARRVLLNLEKFKSVIFDFDQVPTVGQAFADEIFRVFKNKYPDIKLQAVNATKAVQFMIDRVEGNNPRRPNLPI